jgi:hypothetical protein
MNLAKNTFALKSLQKKTEPDPDVTPNHIGNLH